MEQQAFEKAIDENPLESTNHAAYADWLDENGQHDEAAFRRSMGDWLQKKPQLGFPQEVHHEPGNPYTFPWFIEGSFSQANKPEGVGRWPFYHPDEEEHQEHSIDPDVRYPDYWIPRAPHHAAWIEYLDGDGPGYDDPDEPSGRMVWDTYRHMEQALRESFMKNRQARLRRRADALRRFIRPEAPIKK